MRERSRAPITVGDCLEETHVTVAPTHDLALVHLAVKSYGETAFARFVESYRRHPAGRPHDLIIVAKQFADEADFAPFARYLDGLPYHLLLMPDEGIDLGTYFTVARAQPYARYCFLNSLSEILVDGWLDKLVCALEAAPGGVAGTSGSRRSVSSGVRRMHYPGVPQALQKLRGLLGFWKVALTYPPFPNPHLRTNGFVIARETVLRLNLPPFRTKPDTSIFESGWGNLSRQIWKLGGKVLVVDRTGRAHDVPDWADSETFWAGQQQGLLVADKQTRMFISASETRRALLNRLAWGPDGPDLIET